MSAAMEMPRYRCHKEVWALKIASIEWHNAGNGPSAATLTFADKGYAPLTVGVEYTNRTPALGAGGYYVVYKDGYRSFSPAAAFEDGYTRVAS